MTDPSWVDVMNANNSEHTVRVALPAVKIEAHGVRRRTYQHLHGMQLVGRSARSPDEHSSSVRHDGDM